MVTGAGRPGGYPWGISQRPYKTVLEVDVPEVSNTHQTPGV